jgi:hypothetical protein
LLDFSLSRCSEIDYDLFWKETLPSLTHLKTLSLTALFFRSGVKVTPDMLTFSLARLPLTELRLHMMFDHFDDSQCNEFFSSLPSFSSLHTLDLSENILLLSSPKRVASFFTTLAKCPTIHDLNLISVICKWQTDNDEDRELIRSLLSKTHLALLSVTRLLEPSQSCHSCRLKPRS